MHIPNLHVWASFTAGHAIYLYKQADEGAGQQKGIRARFYWIKANWFPLLVSSFVGFCACGYWMLHHDFLSNAASAVGIPANLNLDPNPATGGMFGLGSHAVSDFVTNKLGIQKNGRPNPV